MANLIRRAEVAPPAVVRQAPAQAEPIWIDAFQDEQHGSLARFIEIIKKRRWLVAAVAFTAMAAVVIWTYTTEPLFKSTVRLQIDPDKEVLPYKEILDLAASDPQYLLTQTELLKSRNLNMRVVRRLNLANDPVKIRALAGSLIANLEVAPILGTRIISVSSVSEDPVFATSAVNTLAEEFVDYNIESKYQATVKAREFLSTELMNLKKKLEKSEEDLVQSAHDNNIFVVGEKDNIILRRLTELNEEMTKVESRLLANPYSVVKDAGAQSFPNSLKPQTMKDLEQRRSALEQKLASLSDQFGPRWPEVRIVKAEIDDVDQQIAQEAQRAIEQAKIEYELTSAHREKLVTALAEQNKLVNRVMDNSIQYNILKREVDTDRQLYDGLLQRLKEAGVSAGLKSSNIRIVDRGEVPSRPYYPNIPQNLAVGFILSLALGAGIAFTSEFFDRSVRTPEDVEHTLGLPSLGVIPSLGKAWKNTDSRLLAAAGGSAGEGGKVVPYMSSMGSVCWESYRSLRTALLLSSPDRRPKTILVTSALPSEGKSTTCVNLAISLAQTGAPTVILDLDMRKPAASDMFHLPRKMGMSHFLAGNCELSGQVQQTGIPNLFIVPAGTLPPNPAELLGSNRMEMALQLSSQYFKYVVIDTPPILSVTDALVISSLVDGVVLVIHSGKTAREAVQKARNQLQAVGARILGAVVNDVKVDGSTYRYYQSYGESSYEL